jgi:hypothetical protein
MAEILKRTIKECKRPEDQVWGTAYCKYEYVAFLDCSAGSLTAADTSIGMVEAQGTIKTYNIAGKHTFQEGEIIGTPYSKPIFMGLMSQEWSEEFDKEENKKYLNVPWESENNPGWVFADQHNFFDKQHRFHLAKYIINVPHVLADVDLKNPETGEEVDWACPPTPEDFEPPMITHADWTRLGYTCPPYYELKPCTDCNGQTQDLPTVYWEMADYTNVTPAIVRYPKINTDNSYNCYTPKKLTSGPRGNDNYYNIKLEEQTLAGDWTGQQSCQDCKTDYVVAVASVSNIDSHGGADTALIDNILGSEVPIADAITKGKVAYMLMVKNPANDTFINDQGYEFFYIGGNSNCYKATIMDPSSYDGCIPQTLLNFTRWYKTLTSNGAVIFNDDSIYVHQSAFLNPYGTICDCESGGGWIGNGLSYDICHPPDPVPVVNDIDDVILQLMKDQTTATAKFSVTAAGIGLSYEWYKNGVSVLQGGSSSYSFSAGTKDNGAKIYCTVSNNNGKTKTTSNTATLIVNSSKKVMGDNEEVIAIRTKVYVVSREEWNNLRPTKLPFDSHLKGTTWRWVPAIQHVKKKEWLFELVDFYNQKFSVGGFAEDYSDGFVYFRVMSEETMKWGDLSEALRQIDPEEGDFTEGEDYKLPGPSYPGIDVAAASGME